MIVSVKLRGRNLQIGVSERCVGQSEATRKERLDVVVFVTPIPNENPFTVWNRGRMRIDGREGGKRRIITDLLFECHRQLTGWINISEQDFRQRLPAVLSRIEGLDERGHLIDPKV